MFPQNHQYHVCTYPAAQHKQTFESVPLPLSSAFHYARSSNTPLREPRITETNGTRVQADMESHFCFNPGQPHHLISMYKRTSEYKRASKYKWHERLKYFICHPREVTWQLSCRDWSLMPSWPSSAAKGSLRRIIWPLGALGEASSWDLRLRLATVLGKQLVPSPENLRAGKKNIYPEWTSALLKMKVGTCWVGKNSQPNVKLYVTIFLEVKQILNLSSGLLLSTLGGDVCGLHRFLGWRWGLSCGLLCSLLCHVDWSSVWVTRYLLGKGLNPSWTGRMRASIQLVTMMLQEQAGNVPTLPPSL